MRWGQHIRRPQLPSKRVCYLQFPIGEGMAHHSGPHMEAPGFIRIQKEWGESMSKSLYCGFCGKELVRQGSSLGLASFNHFCGLWAIGLVPSCLSPSPGMIRAGKYCFLEYGSQIEEVVQSMDSGLVCLHIKSVLRDKSFIISRN